MQNTARAIQSGKDQSCRIPIQNKPIIAHVLRRLRGGRSHICYVQSPIRGLPAVSACLGASDTPITAKPLEKSIQRFGYERTVDSWCEALERREFRPHIVVDNDIRQRRVPIFAIAMFCNTEVLKYDVPAGQVLLPEDEQLAKMPTLIRDYLHSEDNERRKLFFRDPVGYTYCPTYDDAWDFDTNGKLLRRKPGPVRPGHAVARIGKKLVSGTGHPSGPAR